MNRRPTVWAMLLLVSCTGVQQATTSSSELPATTASFVTESPTTSTEPEASITATTLVEEPWREPLKDTLPTLDDGRPATFVAVNTDYAAVEVDTATGDVIRVIAQVTTRAQYEEDKGRNTVDAIWRLADGSAYLISECCEPAAGVMYWLKPGEQVVSEDNPLLPEAFASSGWLAAPSPTTQAVAVAGTFVGIVSPEHGDLWGVDPSPNEFNAAGYPSWSRDLSTLWIVGGDGSVDLLWTIDPVSSIVSSAEISWLGQDQYVDGLGTQASGRLVTFRLTNDLARGIVFEPTGELVAEFDIEPGSRMGGYDPSGRFLIYVDGNGTVRWLGVGQTGVLGEGYTFASW